MGSFAELRREVLELHRQSEYAKALELCEEYGLEHPAEAPSITFWTICLNSALDRTDEAARTFRRALAGGLWWSGRYLEDPDLDALKQHPEWPELAAECNRQAAAAEARTPEPVLIEGGSSTLVVFHGYASSGLEAAADWRSAADAGWSLLALQGCVPVSSAGYGWDPDMGSEEVRIQAGAMLSDAGPLVLGGFSQGAGLAAHLAYEGVVAAGGLVLVAPSFAFWGVPNPGLCCRVPAYFIVGSDDPVRADTEQLLPVLDGAGIPVELEVVRGVGHEYPPDFEASLARALDWMPE